MGYIVIAKVCFDAIFDRLYFIISVVHYDSVRQNYLWMLKFTKRGVKVLTVEDKKKNEENLG